MPIIQPISDLRNRAQEIFELCREENQPFFSLEAEKGI